MQTAFVAELMAQTASSSATGSLHARQKLHGSFMNLPDYRLFVHVGAMVCQLSIFLMVAGQLPIWSRLESTFNHYQPLSAHKVLAKSGLASSDFWYPDVFCTGVLLPCNLDKYSFFWV